MEPIDSRSPPGYTDTMAKLLTGIDHYQIVSDAGVESEPAVYGSPCILADPDSGDVLFAFLDIPADNGSIQAAMGLRPVVYRLELPDQEETTVIEDLPEGFDFEQDEDYDSPFETEGEEEDEDEDESEEGEEGEEGEGEEDAPEDEPKDAA